MKVCLCLVEQSFEITLHLDVRLPTPAWHVLLGPVPSLECLLEEVVGKVKGFLDCIPALTLEYKHGVVRDRVRLPLYHESAICNAALRRQSAYLLLAI